MHAKNGMRVQIVKRPCVQQLKIVVAQQTECTYEMEGAIYSVCLLAVRPRVCVHLAWLGAVPVWKCHNFAPYV